MTFDHDAMVQPAAPLRPNSGLPEFGTLIVPKSDISEFGWGEVDLLARFRRNTVWRHPRCKTRFARGSSGRAAIADHQARWPKAMTGDRLQELLAIETGWQGVRREVQREDIEDIMMRRIDRRATRSGIAH